MERYVYEPLPQEYSIRVVTLQPSPRFDDPIDCDIEFVTLDPCVSIDLLISNDPAEDFPDLERPDYNYTTLSYSWGMDLKGDASLNRSIWIRGSRLSVTRNLFEGLLKIRARQEPLRIWVDAICINQEDMQERSAQVAIMARIFASSSHLIVWLGCGRSERRDRMAAAAIKCFIGHDVPHATTIDMIRDHLCYSEAGVPISCCKVITHLKEIARSVNHNTVAAVQKEFSKLYLSTRGHALLNEICASLAALVGRRYLMRRWVIQELYHSRVQHTTVRWGANCSTLSDVLMAHESMVMISNMSFWRLWVCGWEGFPGVLRKIARSQYLLSLVSATNRIEGLTVLLRALKEDATWGCADRRDIVYSILSLDRNFDMIADYSVTWNIVFSRFARQIIATGHGHVVIEALNREKLLLYPRRTSELPSWVPDLRSGLWWRSSDFEHSIALQDILPPTTRDEQMGILACRVTVIGLIRNSDDGLSMHAPFDGYPQFDFVDRHGDYRRATIFKHARAGDQLCTFRLGGNSAPSLYDTLMLLQQSVECDDLYILVDT